MSLPIRRTYLLRAYNGRSQGPEALERTVESIASSVNCVDSGYFTTARHAFAWVELEHASARSEGDTRDLAEVVQRAIYNHARGSVITFNEVG